MAVSFLAIVIFLVYDCGRHLARVYSFETSADAGSAKIRRPADFSAQLSCGIRAGVSGLDRLGKLLLFTYTVEIYTAKPTAEPCPVKQQTGTAIARCCYWPGGGPSVGACYMSATCQLHRTVHRSAANHAAADWLLAARRCGQSSVKAGVGDH